MFFLVFKDIMPPKIEFPSLCPRQTRDGIVALSGIHRRKSLIFPNLAVTCIAQYLNRTGLVSFDSQNGGSFDSQWTAMGTLNNRFMYGCKSLVSFDA